VGEEQQVHGFLADAMSGVLEQELALLYLPAHAVARSNRARHLQASQL